MSQKSSFGCVSDKPQYPMSVQSVKKRNGCTLATAHKKIQHTLAGAEKSVKYRVWPGRKKRIFTIPYVERPKIRRPKYSQNLLDCRPNDARYAFLRPGQIQLENFGAAGRIKDMKSSNRQTQNHINLIESSVYPTTGTNIPPNFLYWVYTYLNI